MFIAKVIDVSKGAGKWNSPNPRRKYVYVYLSFWPSYYAVA